ncbi:MAG: hypothetical protein V3S64_00620, partial [bacterium]
ISSFHCPGPWSRRRPKSPLRRKKPFSQNRPPAKPKAPPGGWKVALLEGEFKTTLTNMYIDPVKMLARLAKSFSNPGSGFKMTHSWYEMNLPNMVSLKNSTDLGRNPWSGFFSKSPDSEVVYAMGKKMGADYLLMFKIYWGDLCRIENEGTEIGIFNVYLVDVQSGNIHEKKGRLLCMTGYREVADAMMGLLGEKAGK